MRWRDVTRRSIRPVVNGSGISVPDSCVFSASAWVYVVIISRSCIMQTSLLFPRAPRVANSNAVEVTHHRVHVGQYKFAHQDCAGQLLTRPGPGIGGVPRPGNYRSP